MSAPSDLFLVVDMQNIRLVAFSGSSSAIRDLFQSNTISLKVQCVNPSISTLPLGSPSYSIQNMGTFGMRAAVTPDPTGTPGGPAVLALQTLTWDNVSQTFVGDLALNTTGVDNYIGALDERQAFFELNLVTPSAGRVTILQTGVNLRAVGDEFLSLVPTPTDQYATLNASKALFQPRIGAPGDVLTLTSPNGLIKMELGIDNSGQFTTNIIQ